MLSKAREAERDVLAEIADRMESGHGGPAVDVEFDPIESRVYLCMEDGSEWYVQVSRLRQTTDEGG